jgi:hypothetical protein
MTTHDSDRKAPWHLWAVGILSLLWNGAGAYTIVMAQAGRLANLSTDEVAYYAAQPAWYVILVDIAVIAPVLAAVALLLRSRFAVLLFAVGLAAVLCADVYELAAGTSRALLNATTMIVTSLILAIAILQLWYSQTMRTRAVLLP